MKGQVVIVCYRLADGRGFNKNKVSLHYSLRLVNDLHFYDMRSRFKGEYPENALRGFSRVSPGSSHCTHILVGRENPIVLVPFKTGGLDQVAPLKA